MCPILSPRISGHSVEFHTSQRTADRVVVIYAAATSWWSAVCSPHFPCHRMRGRSGRSFDLPKLTRPRAASTGQVVCRGYVRNAVAAGLRSAYVSGEAYKKNLAASWRSTCTLYRVERPKRRGVSSRSRSRSRSPLSSSSLFTSPRRSRPRPAIYQRLPLCSRLTFFLAPVLLPRLACPQPLPLLSSYIPPAAAANDEFLRKTLRIEFRGELGVLVLHPSIALSSLLGFAIFSAAFVLASFPRALQFLFSSHQFTP